MTAVKRRRRRQQAAYNRLEGATRLESGQLAKNKTARKDNNKLREVKRTKEAIMTQKEAQSVVVDARMRQYGLSERDAQDARGMTVIGRLYQRCRDGEELEMISQAQYEAAVWFLDRRNDYKKACLSPDAYWSQYGGRGTIDEEAYEAFVKAAKETWQTIRETLQEAQTQYRAPIIEAIKQFVIEDRGEPHLLGDLRNGLNDLGKLKERLTVQGKSLRIA